MTKPLALAGYSYEDEGLPEEILDAVRDAPASLPILQFACSQLWSRRDIEQRLFTRVAYEEMGGVEGALASEADELLAGLSEKQRKVVRERAQVTTIIPGPPGTIIAGFENGALGIWSTETGERLFSHQLHGLVIHLLLRDQKLYAATELGSRVLFDLRIFYIEYCDLMERVWREVFWIWECGRARYRGAPTDHECSKSQ